MNDHPVRLYHCSMSDMLHMPTSMQMLREEEIVRAQQFRFDKDRMVYTSAHSFLNHQLTNELNTTPDALPIYTTEYGKPMLKDSDVWYNLSHSRNSWTIAITKSGEVGVDIEEIKPKERYLDLLDSYFSKGEKQMILTAPEPIKEFFRIWTRKEAVLKLLGVGLNFKLQDFDVTNDVTNLSTNNSSQEIFLYSYPLVNSFLSLATFRAATVELIDISRQFTVFSAG